MLQSTDLAKLESDLTEAGAEVTHQLPIIDAIGARMSEAQLDAVLAKNDTISRVIDDLAWNLHPSLVPVMIARSRARSNLAGAVRRRAGRFQQKRPTDHGR